MRHISILLPFILLTSILSASGITTGYARFFEAEDLRTLNSYLSEDNDLQQRFRTLVPTQPADLTGQYFIVRNPFIGHDRSDAQTVRITYFPSDEKDPRTQIFDFPTDSAKWLYFGLSGDDWPDPSIEPLAWKLEILDDGGDILATWKSFLWEMPE